MSPDVLTRYLAIIFLFVVMIGSFVVAAYQISQGLQPNAYIMDVLGAGLGFSMTTAGVAHGAMIAVPNQNTTVLTTPQSGSAPIVISSSEGGK